MEWIKRHSFAFWILACNIGMIILQTAGTYWASDHGIMEVIDPLAIPASLTTIIITTIIQLMFEEGKPAKSTNLIIISIIVVLVAGFILAFRDVQMNSWKHTTYSIAVITISAVCAVISFILLSRTGFKSIDLVEDRIHEKKNLQTKLDLMNEVRNEPR